MDYSKVKISTDLSNYELIKIFRENYIGDYFSLKDEDKIPIEFSEGKIKNIKKDIYLREYYFFNKTLYCFKNLKINKNQIIFDLLANKREGKIELSDFKLIFKEFNEFFPIKRIDYINQGTNTVLFFNEKVEKLDTEKIKHSFYLEIINNIFSKKFTGGILNKDENLIKILNIYLNRNKLFDNKEDFENYFEILKDNFENKKIFLILTKVIKNYNYIFKEDGKETLNNLISFFDSLINKIENSSLITAYINILREVEKRNKLFHRDIKKHAISKIYNLLMKADVDISKLNINLKRYYTVNQLREIFNVVFNKKSKTELILKYGLFSDEEDLIKHYNIYARYIGEYLLDLNNQTPIFDFILSKADSLKIDELKESLYDDTALDCLDKLKSMSAICENEKDFVKLLEKARQIIKDKKLDKDLAVKAITEHLKLNNAFHLLVKENFKDKGDGFKLSKEIKNLNEIAAKKYFMNKLFIKLKNKDSFENIVLIHKDWYKYFEYSEIIYICRSYYLKNNGYDFMLKLFNYLDDEKYNIFYQIFNDDQSKFNKFIKRLDEKNKLSLFLNFNLKKYDEERNEKDYFTFLFKNLDKIKVEYIADLYYNYDLNKIKDDRLKQKIIDKSKRINKKWMVLFSEFEKEDIKEAEKPAEEVKEEITEIPKVKEKKGLFSRIFRK